MYRCTVGYTSFISAPISWEGWVLISDDVANHLTTCFAPAGAQWDP